MASDIKETLKKIHTLSIQGASDGEKFAAQSQLDRLLKKYNLTLSDIVDEAKDLYRFTFRNQTEKRLLIQIGAKVADSHDFRSCGREKGVRWLELTKAEFAEVTFLYSEYKSAYKKELETFFHAFVQKNRLFPSTKDESDSEEKELTLEQRQENYKILQMARGMSQVPVSRKRLEK